MSVLVVGSIAYDSIETPTAQIDETLGGSAVYFSAAASYFVPVNLVAVVGEDFRFADISFLQQQGVDLNGITTENGKTFRWKGKYLHDMNDRETIYTELNVFEKFNPILPKNYRDSRFVFLANINPDLQYNVIRQVKNPLFVAMDTMNFWISGTPDELKKTLAVVDALLINDAEVRQLSGVDNLITGARKIQEMGPQTLVVKKGEHGALLVHRNNLFFCPAYPVENLFDPTGAGDTFAGGFMGYLSQAGEINGRTLRRAMVVATAMASFCVEAFSVERLKALSKDRIRDRVLKLTDLTRLEGDENWMEL